MYLECASGEASTWTYRERGGGNGGRERVIKVNNFEDIRHNEKNNGRKS